MSKSALNRLGKKHFRMTNVPLVSLLVYPVAKNWIAGKSISEAINYSELANARGFSVILNYLGEEVNTAREVQESLTEYEHLLDLLQPNRIEGCVSAKLTQLGLKIGKDYCRKNLVEIVDYASRLGRFVWIDMESSKFTDDTMSIYRTVFSTSKNVGICIQSYLRRSEEDIGELIRIGGKIRLVKGAYDEPATIAYKSRKEIDKSYAKLMAHLFKDSESLFSVATHDDRLIYEAMRMSKEHAKNFEFAFLKGIRNNLKLELVNKGYRVTEYIPYGQNWMPYSIRRLREKPSNFLLLARSLLSK
ncbi:MAG: proline dehydrogenase family protein [Candidatus Bathyarchaeia archaeon]